MGDKTPGVDSECEDSPKAIQPIQEEVGLATLTEMVASPNEKILGQRNSTGSRWMRFLGVDERDV